MLIACPSCATTYQIELAALGPAGRSVRCSHCRNTWFATQGDALAATAAAMAAEPDPEPAPVLPALPASRDMAPTADWVVADAPPAPDVEAPDVPAALIEAPPIVPDAAPAPFPAADTEAVPDAIESVVARRASRIEARRKRPSLARRLASAPTLIVALLVLLGATVYWRTIVVRYLPQTASLFATIGLPVNLRGLIFADVKSVSEPQDGMTVLIVEGTIINITRDKLDVPRLRFALRNGAGQEIYAWTALPGKPQLGAGDGLAFRTRLASPPAEGRDVVVRFFNRRDVAAGLQ